MPINESFADKVNRKELIKDANDKARHERWAKEAAEQFGSKPPVIPPNPSLPQPKLLNRKTRKKNRKHRLKEKGPYFVPLDK